MTAGFLQVWSKERPYERRNTQKNVGSSTWGGRLSAPQADVSCLLASLRGDRLGSGVGLPGLHKISSPADRRLPQPHPRKPRVPSFSTAWLWPSLDGDLCLGNHPGWQVLLRASAVDVRRSRTARTFFSLERLAATCGQSLLLLCMRSGRSWLQPRE